MATIKELKEKMLNAIDEIDLTKLTLFDLNTVSMTVKTISETDDEKFSTKNFYMDMLNKMSVSSNSMKNNTIADLKGAE